MGSLDEGLLTRTTVQSDSCCVLNPLIQLILTRYPSASRSLMTASAPWACARGAPTTAAPATANITAKDFASHDIPQSCLTTHTCHRRSWQSPGLGVAGQPVAVDHDIEFQ